MDRKGRSIEVRRTLYFNGKALKRSTQSGSGNYYDVETTESYWVSGVKKKGGDRHWAGRGKITIDAGAVDEFLQLTGATELDRSMFVVSAAIKPPDAKNFTIWRTSHRCRPIDPLDRPELTRDSVPFGDPPPRADQRAPCWHQCSK